MDRELLLVLLLLFVGGPLFWAWGSVPLRSPLRVSGRASEAARWRAVWLPAVLPLLALAGLLGWASHEPREAEGVGSVRVLIVVPAAIVWARASIRAIWSVLRARHPGPAATVGLLRPRVVIDPAFALVLDAEETAAALAHERAHARHHDPLRLLLAQLVTDLQWPVPAACRRLKDWGNALELARDEEARLDGADPAALAKAIVLCVKLARRDDDPAVVTLGGDDRALEVRVGRLLDDQLAVHDGPSKRRAIFGGLLAMATVFALAGGVLGGEEVVRILLRVLT